MFRLIDNLSVHPLQALAQIAYLNTPLYDTAYFKTLVLRLSIPLGTEYLKS